MSEKHLSGFESDELVTELIERGYMAAPADDLAAIRAAAKKHGYFVTEDDPDERGCEACEEREHSGVNQDLEKIHYLLAGNKITEAVEQMRGFIYDQIGRSS